MGDYFEIYLTVIAETSEALLLSDGDVEEWIPRSQIRNTDSFMKGGDYDFEIKPWILEEKGFI